MKLHEAIERLLIEAGHSMTTVEIANALNKKKWYQKKDKSEITDFQIHGRTRKYSQLFIRNSSNVTLIKQKIIKKVKTNQAILSPRNSNTIGGRDEDYVIDLCDKVLKMKSSRQHKFDFLVGDVNAKGFSRRLPVDAYYENLKLVVEYRERQHTESIALFDKPEIITISVVYRGEQRKMYDEKRRTLIPKNSLTLIEISYSDFSYNKQKKIIRDEKNDLDVIKRILKEFI